MVCPYYNKPTQEGLYQHFKAVHDAVDLPIIIYNIPIRAAVDMSVQTMARLAKLPNIVGVKDATNDSTRPLKMRIEIEGEISLLSGEDGTAVAYLAQGGDGCISVTANNSAAWFGNARGVAQKGDIATVRAINERLIPLNRRCSPPQPSAGQVRRPAARPLLAGWPGCWLPGRRKQRRSGHSHAGRRADQLKTRPSPAAKPATYFRGVNCE